VAAELPCSLIEATASREKTRRSKWSDPDFGMERFMGLLGSRSGRGGCNILNVLVFFATTTLTKIG
jgi:hypothetical protein